MTKLLRWAKEHKYSYSMLYLLLYLFLFVTVERVTEPTYRIHSVIDDMIPFNSIFLIFYVSWFIAYIGSLVFFVFYDKEDYQNLSFIMMNGSF